VSTHSSGPTPSRPRLLYLDDDVYVRRALARVLGTEFDVVVVGSAGEAVARLASGERFDAFVTDLEMPDGDGFQAIARVAAFDTRLARRAVICTGAHMTDDERAAHAASGFVIVTKGARSTDLIDAIRAQIAKYP